jgi:hypothetical protein
VTDFLAHLISRLTGTAGAIAPRPAARFEPEFPGSEGTAYDLGEERGEEHVPPAAPPPDRDAVIPATAPADRDAVLPATAPAEPRPAAGATAEIMPPVSTAGERRRPSPAFQGQASPGSAIPDSVLPGVVTAEPTPSGRAPLPPDPAEFRSAVHHREPAVQNRTLTRAAAPHAEPATAAADGEVPALPPAGPAAPPRQSPAPLPVSQSAVPQTAVPHTDVPQAGVPVPASPGGPAAAVALPAVIARPVAPPDSAEPPFAEPHLGTTHPGDPAERGLRPRVRPLSEPSEGRGSSRSRSAPPDSGPTIEVTIGRVEIRGPAAAAQPPARRRAVDPPRVLALPEYLARRRRTS